jgi:hypothetical protein
MIGAMTADPIRIVLEVQVVNESLIGLARASDGTTRDFSGWLGLLSVVETLLPAAAGSEDLEPGEACRP